MSAKATMAVEFDSDTEQLGILLRDGLELELKRDGVTVWEEGAAVVSFPLSAEDGSFLVTALSDGASLTLTVNGTLLCYGREIGAHVNRFGFRTDGGDVKVYGISYRYAEKVYAERPAEQTYPQPQPPGDANLTPSTSVPDYVPTQGQQGGCASRTAGTSTLAALVCLAGTGLYLAIKGRENL